MTAGKTGAKSGMAGARRRLEVVHLPVDQLRPNPWNPNRVPPEIMHKLREYIRREGLVEPLVVRHAPEGGRYEILGGFHRWTICKNELGYAEVPCVVVDIDDKRARVLTINLNELSGDPVPALLAELVHDLNRDTSLDDLATMLPYSPAELQDLEDLLKLPDGLEAFLDEEDEKQAREAPNVVSFVVHDTALVDRAVDHAVAGMDGTGRRGRALVALATAYLEKHQLIGGDDAEDD